MTNFGYTLLDGHSFSHELYAIESIRTTDALPIMKWRNDQIDSLRQKKPLSSVEQNQYFENTVENEFLKERPNPLLVRFTSKERLIGYGGLVHIDWNLKIGEVSFLLETQRAKKQVTYCQDLTVFMVLIKKLAFDYLDFHKITTESYAHRSFHVETIEKCGFTREGVLRNHAKVGDSWVDAVLCSCLQTEYKSKTLNI